MVDAILNLYRFLVNPMPSSEFEPLNRKAITSVLYLFLFTYVIKTVWLLTVNRYLRTLFPIERSEIVNTHDGSLLIFFVSAVIIYPIIEEIIFRYPLKGKRFVSLIFVSICLSLLGFWIAKGFEYSSLQIKRAVLIFSVVLPAFTLIYTYYMKARRNELRGFYNRYYFILFYTSVISFALLHSFNFEIGENAFFLLPFIVPMIISGLTLGYVRVKYGMWANIILHMGFNLTTFVLDKGLGI